MVVTGRPLLDTERDASLFVGRDDEVTRVLIALEHGLNCLIYGERGIGKTSLIRHVMYLARATPAIGGVEFFLVQGSRAKTASALLAEVLVRTEADHASGTHELFDLSVSELVALLERWANDAASDMRRVIVLDDPSARVANTLFGGFRDDLWAIDLQWLVTTDASSLQELLAPPADAFFEASVGLTPLGARAATELLGRRIDNLPAGVASRALEASGGNPRELMSTLRSWLEAGESGSTWTHRIEQGKAIQANRLARLGRSAQMLFAELQMLGSASASDAGLLQRMGWTRARASQVLAQLEKEGLVRGENVRQDAGRPRRVFSPVPLEDVVDSVARAPRDLAGRSAPGAAGR